MAGGKRVQSTPSALKWKGSERSRETSKGIKPLPDPMTLAKMFEVLIMHLCRKVLLMDTFKKICIYAVEIIFGSLLCDFFPLPKLFFANKGNIFNVYFAKVSMGWTVVLVGTFTALSSYVYCCGKVNRVRLHVSRLFVGTLCWYLCAHLFSAIETWSSVCVGGENILSKEKCLKNNLVWKSFDICDGSFLLIYCCLVVHEEAKAIKGWDRIKDLIREVNYDDDSVLKNLSEDELKILKSSYDKYDLYVKISFVSITALGLFWELLLVGTILYYHSLAQKVAGGLMAVLVWFLTYKCWFNIDFSPGLPGQGLFKYNVERPVSNIEDRRRSIVGLRSPIRAVGVRNGTQLENDS